VALVVIIGGGMFFSSMQESARLAEQEALELKTTSLASEISGTFSNIQNQLKELAQELEVIQYFKAGDPAIQNARVTEYQNRFDHALLLRMLFPGNYVQDSSVIPPFSFASLEMMRRAQSGSRTAAEVHLFGTDEQHVVMINSVADEGGEVIGFLHLSLDVSTIEQSMSGITPDNYYVEVQPGIGKKLVLASKGDAGLKEGEPVSKLIPLTSLRLAYWEEGFASGAGGSGGFGILPIIIAIIILIIAAYIYKTRFSGGMPKSVDVDGEGIIYGGAIQAIMDGAHPGVEELIPNLPKSAGKPEQQAEAIPLSEGMAGSDITTIAKPSDVSNADNDITQPEYHEQPTPEASLDEPDFDITGEIENAAPQADEVEPGQASPGSLDPGIFRTYDIRGIVGEQLNADTVYKIGQAIGSEALARGEQGVIVGRDGRTSSPELGDALVAGLRASGRDVIDIGLVPTPVLYFATHTLGSKSGVMLTGSHNGPEYNGLKIVLGGETLSEEAITSIYNRIQNNEMEVGEGTLQSQDVATDYIRRISEDIPVALGGAFKLVIDCGNGVPGVIAPQLYRSLGHDVIEMYCEVDGNFPNHHPDPSQPDNLQALIDKVKEEGADLGFAFDGEGDRLGVVDSEGNIIWPDRQLMLLAKDVLTRNPGADIIFDVKCSRFLRAIIESSGGNPLMWKTGHSLIKSKMKEVESPLAGEMSGHIFFKERWYGFDDALYTGARMLEILMNAKAKPVDTFAELPEGISTPELRVDLHESQHQDFMDQIKDKISFDDATIYDIDGFRVEFADGWGLIRPSNTTPCLVLRFEADSQAALDRIIGDFKSLLLSINPDLVISF
jgi:phosphomannomutase/phosphoglucomutase